MSVHDPSGKFTRMNQIHASFHDFVCYLAYEQATGIQVFWFEFLNENLTPQEIEQSFQNLNQIKSISSPYILNVLDVWKTTTPPRFIVITEAIQGPFLCDYVKTLNPVPTRSILKWFKQIALAVQALHKSQYHFAHGQLTMKNIILKTTTGSIKLRLYLTVISCRHISSSTLSVDIYKSPERLNGVISPATDIWSLGIILLELLGDGRPYDECLTPIDLVNSISQHKLPKSIESVRKKNPAAEDLICKCLQPEMFRINIDQLLAHPLLQDNPSPSPQKPIQLLDLSNENSQEKKQDNQDFILNIT